MGSLILKTISAPAVKGPGPRQFRFTISTGDLDRDKDRLNPTGWDLRGYLASPVVLWAHDHSQPAIARSVEIGVIGEALKATAEFPPPGVYPFADQVHDLIAAGIIATASVGFLPKDRTRNEFGGHDVKSQELVEWSIVNVPSLPAAVVERRAAGIDPVAVTKWLHGGGVRASAPGLIEIDEHLIATTVRATIKAAMAAKIHEYVRQAVLRLTGRLD